MKMAATKHRADPAPLADLNRPGLTASATALLLDFDGTLADIVDDPAAVSVDAETRSVLGRLQNSTGGALAIVTGRPIRDIDRFLDPLKLPVAGVHGLERRNAAGDTVTAAIDETMLARLRERLQTAVRDLPGTAIEVKPGSVALHYRRNPAAADRCIAAVHEAVADLSGLDILHGKMVIEIKGGKGTKGDSVTDFMDEEPFKGRRAVFAGDDVTDEDGFGAIARRGGISIKIGDGDTTAAYRAEGTAEFRRWLTALADGFDASKEAD